MPDVILQKRIPIRTVVNHVAVLLPLRRKRRVKVFWNLNDIPHCDVRWQKLDECFTNALARNRRVDPKTGHLPESVYSRVRSPGRKDIDVLAGQFANRLFDGNLHRRPVRLDLPPDITEAVIGNCHSDVSHQRSPKQGKFRSAKKVRSSRAQAGWRFCRQGGMSSTVSSRQSQAPHALVLVLVLVSQLGGTYIDQSALA